MSLKPSQLWIVQTAEELCDAIRRIVMNWDYLSRSTVGQQLIRSADSVGANIVEGYGRFHAKDRLRFYFISRASLEETIYWIRRARAASLMDFNESKRYLGRYSLLSGALDNFIRTQTPL